eukprot:TRINITY_DN6013_c0_g1_i4.p1 TRINITY_DN6013_c0_g1~~TRINITY_DN6013_c0_g1_i4.p1  ORF type:complete len:814 (-),score=125.40 TRINITY_DN6013_c0_g1_i4:2532-4973(-)
MASRSSMLFKGVNVFLSRSLVPPEVFDAVHDALRLNGASLFLCCDPSRNSPNDFHVISSPDHEKFEDLKAKGCNLLGPQCIFSCAKERRPLPKQGYTCCLAMDGVKVLASGFDMDEKVKTENLVTSMGGVFLTKASLDVSFVIVKNVLAAKYKWAHNVLKKPIVTSSWLQQCWIEHRVVPQEPYRILPFTGLTICATRIPADVRKMMESLIIQNGGQYSADLTRKCTHLVCDTPEGDKYLVARKWGHINIVSKKWFDQSVERRACLDEEFYPVHGAPNSSTAGKSGLKRPHTQHKGTTTLQSVPSNTITEMEATASQSTSSFSDATVVTKEGSEAPSLQSGGDGNLGGCVAHDSQSEDSDLYLSECRILFVGFETTKMRKLVNMVRRGGGTRHMSFSEKLTHIVVGKPTEIERKEVRRYASWGVINVVRTIWLEDCDRERKEIPVTERHVVSDLLLPKDGVCSNQTAAIGISNTRQEKSFISTSSEPTDNGLGDANFKGGSSLYNSGENLRLETILKASNSVEAVTKSDHLSHSYAVKNSNCRLQCDSEILDAREGRLSNIFRGQLFRFSHSFPVDRRAEIVEWVIQGGGKMVNDQATQDVHFIIECHGVTWRPTDVSQSATVSSHWIRFCLEEGYMVDVGSHILYSPLPCQVPLPGFECLKFCISQYEEKDRVLSRNLCHVLGAKFTEKLSKKVTHLLCKFTSGPKYEAACKWGVQSVTAEWITECIRQNTMVALDPFRPKAASAQDRDAGLCTMTQYPTQAARMVSGDVPPSQLHHEFQNLKKLPALTNGNIISEFAIVSTIEHLPMFSSL